MASATTATQTHLGPRDGYDAVFCHSCLHEWYTKKTPGSPLPCPSCQGEIIEIIGPENDPREYIQWPTPGDPVFSGLLRNITATYGSDEQRSHEGQDAGTPSHNEQEDFQGPDGFQADTSHGYDPFSSTLNRLYQDDPQPEDDMNFSDPEVADIDDEEFSGPNNYQGRQSGFQSPNQGSNGGVNAPGRVFQEVPTLRERPRPATPPTAHRVIFDSENPAPIIDTIRRLMANSHEREQSGSPDNTSSNTAARRGSDHTDTTGPTPADGAAASGWGDFNAVFANIMGSLGPPNTEGRNPRATGGNRAGSRDSSSAAQSLQQLYSAFVNRRFFEAGDFVHSDDALDRIVSMLMERNDANTGPPPASEAILEELERTTVDASMLGPDGCAECSICISEIPMDDEVLRLPCKHWFHDECVLTWLRQHNTCPVCRLALESDEPDSTNDAARSAPPPSADDYLPSGRLFNIRIHLEVMEDYMRVLHERSMRIAQWRHETYGPDRVRGNHLPELVMPSEGEDYDEQFPMFAGTAQPADADGARSGSAAVTWSYRSPRGPDADYGRRRRDSHSPVLSPGTSRSLYTTVNGNPTPSSSERFRGQRN
ncbi:hypothetical protein SEPCBS119000_000603 [Sporothrix epigloea]|uniref:RING-type domain-containing protein n=1 Tax=Sporothrix epigloea TaxID=1892477 RepID=A0ABP0D636_9PEZI